MAAPILLLADAVTAVLNTGGAFTPALSATREYLRLDTLPGLTTRKVYVLPRQDDSPAKADRARWAHQLIVDVAVSKKLSGDTNAERDEICDVADAICEYVKANRPIRPEKLMGATVRALWDPERLKTEKVMTSVVTFTFEDVR